MFTHRLITVDVPTRERSQMIEVTHHVQKAVREAGVREGMVIVHVPHTTAAVTSMKTPTRT